MTGKRKNSREEIEALHSLMAEQYYKIADLQTENFRLKDLLENFSIGKFVERDKTPAEYYYIDCYGVNGSDCNCKDDKFFRKEGEGEEGGKEDKDREEEEDKAH
jgi:hypothetical protein